MADDLTTTEMMTMATFEAVATTRAVAGKVTLQGGNALKYVYGSPRASVDVDFLSSASRQEVKALAAKALEICQQWAPRLQLDPSEFSFTSKRTNNTRNPMVFFLLHEQPASVPYRRVKLESFQVEPGCLQNYTADSSRPARGRHINFVTPYLATATPAEILVDKTHALANRGHPKARDVFDITWLVGNMREQIQPITHNMWSNHLRMYGQQDSDLEETRAKALSRIEDMQSRASTMAGEIGGFLPYPVDAPMFESWCETARVWIETLSLPKNAASPSNHPPAP